MDERTGPPSPRFSIVVPAYNEAHYLGPALESLLAQDFAGPYEVIVVDNNSDDDTAAVAAAYGVRVVHETEQGVCAARQRGAEVACGDILVTTDADTVQPRNWLRAIDAAFAGAGADVVAVCGPCQYADPKVWTQVYPKLLFGLVQGLYRLTGYVVYITATNIAMRRSAFPGYDLKLTQGGDELDLLRRLRHQGRVVWDADRVVTTSARRLQRGFFYNFFATFLVYYLLFYFVNRWSPRRALGMAPVVRETFAEDGAAPPEKPRRDRRRLAVTVAVVAAASLGLVTFAAPMAMAALDAFLDRR